MLKEKKENKIWRKMYGTIIWKSLNMFNICFLVFSFCFHFAQKTHNREHPSEISVLISRRSDKGSVARLMWRCCAYTKNCDCDESPENSIFHFHMDVILKVLSIFVVDLLLWFSAAWVAAKQYRFHFHEEIGNMKYHKS